MKIITSGDLTILEIINLFHLNTDARLVGITYQVIVEEAMTDDHLFSVVDACIQVQLTILL